MLNQVETVAERLNRIMSERGIKQAELSELSGIYIGTLSHYVKGDYEPKNKQLVALARALHVSELWLMGLDVPVDGKLPELSSEAKEIGRAYDAMSAEGRALVRRMLGLEIKEE